ncbi:MAG: YidC/Oxa1 family membrane protein insertase [Stenotrophomonas maltophilia]
MEILVTLWTEVIIRPMLNILLVLYVIFFSNMGLAIVVFTVMVRLATLPLTLKQLRQMRGMTTMQPKVKEIQERYSGDRARVSQETMKLYKESNISPFGCLGPMIPQMLILFGLFRVLVQTLFDTPNDLVRLADKLYSWIPFDIHAAAPLNNNFFGLDLSTNPPTYLFIIPLMVAASTWVQQKMTMTPSADPKQQSSQTMMLWMIPIMLGMFSFNFPIGLSLYWTVSNLIGVAIQYFITGWAPLFPLFPRSQPAPTTSESPPPKTGGAAEEMAEHGSSNKDRPNRRRSRRTGAERARRRPQRGRGRSSK